MDFRHCLFYSVSLWHSTHLSEPPVCSLGREQLGSDEFPTEKQVPDPVQEVPHALAPALLFLTVVSHYFNTFLITGWVDG